MDISMIDMDILTKTISDKLQKEKYNVINENRELRVVLPMFCDVSARITNDQIDIKSKFGKVERSKAIAIDIFAVVIIIVLSTSMNSVFLLICAIVAVVWDIIRWQKTQRVINIISNAYHESLNT